MPTRMTPTMWALGIRNALICGGVLLAAWWVTAWGIAMITGQSVRGSAGAAFDSILVAVFVTFFAAWLFSRASAGRVILDCGPHPARWLFVVCAVLMMVSGGLALLDSHSPAAFIRVGGPGYLLTLVAFYATLATGRLQVREHGVWQYWGLLRWNKINSYQWRDETTLMLRGSGPFRFMVGAVAVPAEHRAAIGEALSHHGVAAAV